VVWLARDSSRTRYSVERNGCGRLRHSEHFAPREYRDQTGLLHFSKSRKSEVWPAEVDRNCSQVVRGEGIVKESGA
jgi:hypothetical protein